MSRRITAAVVMTLLAGIVLATPAVAQQPDRDAASVRAFNNAVATYLELHGRIEASLGHDARRGEAAARGDFAALLKETHDEKDELGRALINERWPGTALTTMPADMLAALPPLPPELEYRFVHRDLVLWDVSADLIVDVLRDAIPTKPLR